MKTMIVFLGERKMGMKKDKRMKYGMGGTARESYMGGGMYRKPMAHGGKAGYSSVRDMEKACMTKADHNMSMRQK
jgi:hypothetical protein